jgi:hypothetical protein
MLNIVGFAQNCDDGIMMSSEGDAEVPKHAVSEP